VALVADADVEILHRPIVIGSFQYDNALHGCAFAPWIVDPWRTQGERVRHPKMSGRECVANSDHEVTVEKGAQPLLTQGKQEWLRHIG